MKMFLYAFLIIFGVAACSHEPEFREEVIERYAGGEKMVVVQYRGIGASEQLVKRFTYDESGDLILKEDLTNNIKLDWVQLNSGVSTARGLEKYLQGEWVLKQVEENGRYIELDGDVALGDAGLNVSGTIFTWTSQGEGQASDSFAVEYKRNYVVSVSQPENADKPPEMLELVIASKNSFSIALGGITTTFLRKNR